MKIFLSAFVLALIPALCAAGQSSALHSLAAESAATAVVPEVPGPASSGVEKPLQPGLLAPSFSLPDLKGEEWLFDQSDPDSPFAGKITVLLFFASWCSHCKNELPYVKQLHEKYAGDSRLVITGVRTYRARETEEINSFVKRMGLKFLILSDTPKEDEIYSRTAKLYQVTGVPHTLIIDGEGVIRHLPRVSDFSSYVSEMSALIDPLLAETR